MKQAFTLPALLATVALATTAHAQDVTNNGATIALTGGAILFVPGNVTNTAAGSVLDLSNGANNLYVGGNLVNGSASTLAAGTSSLVTLNGAAVQQLALGTASLANLTVANTSGATTGAVTVPSNGTITGALVLTSGLVKTAQAATLTLADGATLTGEQNGRYVAGNLAAVKTTVSGATAFPNGIVVNPAAALSNLTVTRTAGLQTAQVSYGTNIGSANKGIDQIWQSSQALPGTALTLTWLSDNDNGLTFSTTNTQMWGRATPPSATTGWQTVDGVRDGTSRSITSTTSATSAFSFFTVSTTAAPLPVTLTAFTVARAGDAALLKWTTASELNNDHFDVEMSIDGMTFRKIGQVAGHGTSTTANTYQLTDPRLLAYAADPVYYRLRQVDNSGTSAFSPVRTVRVESTLGFALAAYPNPLGSGGTHLQVRTGLAGSLTLAAYDATGRLVFSHPADLQPGTNAIELPEAGSLATGVYYLKASQAGQSAVLKLTRE